jgi:hypothetical protein
MTNFTPAQLGKGKAVHAMHTANAALKGSMVGGCTGSDTVICVDASTAITCKRCLKALPSWDTVNDHSAPAVMNAAPMIQDSRTGVKRRILGTSLNTNAPHKTVVWVQREGEAGAQAWSADSLMSTWHDLVAIDEIGDTAIEAARREALEYAEVIAFEQKLHDELVSEGWSAADAREMVEGCRDVSTPWSESTPERERHDELLRRHGSAVPFVLRAAEEVRATTLLKAVGYHMGGGLFAVPLTDGKMLLGLGNLVAPSRSLTLDAAQIAELRGVLNARDAADAGFGL